MAILLIKVALLLKLIENYLMANMFFNNSAGIFSLEQLVRDLKFRVTQSFLCSSTFFKLFLVII
jgi:hypothetical protein